jgi:endogenous inhibitor of DNA gyrase (YacG/DUF329 family)
MSGTCPICGKAAASRAENPSAPFCSARCRQIDLGKWLLEEYRIPTNEPAEEPSNVRELAAGNRKESAS